MELSIAEAAARLGVSPRQVQHLVSVGRLSGRRLAGRWLVDLDSVALAASQERRSGRPMAPVRAWGMLDLLEGGRAPWLPSVARSQVRAQLKRMQQQPPTAGQWRSLLGARSTLARAQGHPAALDRLRVDPRLRIAGAREAIDAGADLSVAGSVLELYVRSPECWASLVAAGNFDEVSVGGNVTARIPVDVWLFDDRAPGPAVLAADLLESAEPRAVSGGLQLLRELVEQGNFTMRAGS